MVQIRNRPMQHSFWVDARIWITRCGTCLTLSFLSSVSLHVVLTSSCLSEVARYLIYDSLCYAFSVRWHVLSITWFIFCYKAN
jgi:hypothetical protein